MLLLKEKVVEELIDSRYDAIFSRRSGIHGQCKVIFGFHKVLHRRVDMLPLRVEIRRHDLVLDLIVLGLFKGD